MISIKTGYSQNKLDRMDSLRGEENFLKKKSSSQNSLYLLIYNHKIVVQEQGEFSYLTFSQVQQYVETVEHQIFLGSKGGTYYFAVHADDKHSENLKLIDIKSLSLGCGVSENDLGVIAQATSVMYWNHENIYCGKCARKTEQLRFGWQRNCNHCHTQKFPRIDPVVMMLVTNGNQCLLGAGLDYSFKRFSCLAGFMEPGETVEGAALRELHEEVGLTGIKVSYITSQPWPFPSTLMIGVHVEVDNKEVKLEENEIRETIWVDKTEIYDVLAGKINMNFDLPPSFTIAHSLLKYWCNDSSL